MTKGLEEAEAIEALATVRDFCAESVIEFMAACGVRTTTPPPQLVELLTLYGLRAIDIGQELAHRKATFGGIAPALRGGAMPIGSGIAPALRRGTMPAEAAEAALDDRSESGVLPTAHGSRRRRRPSAEITSKIVLSSRR